LLNPRFPCPLLKGRGRSVSQVWPKKMVGDGNACGISLLQSLTGTRSVIVSVVRTKAPANDLFLVRAKPTLFQLVPSQPPLKLHQVHGPSPVRFWLDGRGGGPLIIQAMAWPAREGRHSRGSLRDYSYFTLFSGHFGACFCRGGKHFSAVAPTILDIPFVPELHPSSFEGCSHNQIPYYSSGFPLPRGRSPEARLT